MRRLVCAMIVGLVLLGLAPPSFAADVDRPIVSVTGNATNGFTIDRPISRSSEPPLARSLLFCKRNFSTQPNQLVRCQTISRQTAFWLAELRVTTGFYANLVAGKNATISGLIDYLNWEIGLVNAHFDYEDALIQKCGAACLDVPFPNVPPAPPIPSGVQ